MRTAIKFGLLALALGAASANGAAMAASAASTDPNVAQPLALMDQARAGKVTRRQYVSAMDAQYTRLAGNTDETAQPRVRTSSAPHR